MRSRIRGLILDILGRISKPSCSIFVLNGHYVHLNETDRDAAQFEQLLNLLSKDFDFMPFDQACKKIINHEKVNRPTIAFSFDDGFKECYTAIAPILEKFGTNACFFINPSVIDVPDDIRNNFLRYKLKLSVDKKFMTWTEIEELYKRGHEIGNHTMHHSALTGMSYENNVAEILQGKDALETRLGFRCCYFAIPYGGGPEYFDENGLRATLANHELSFSSYLDKKYFFNGNASILERRHFEGGWPEYHVRYFLSGKRIY